jgi:TetR/AcrR family transcriptional regulator, transcriptional repressor for nem operon
MRTTETRDAIMAAGRATVQAHGYNGLSFREIAKAVGVKSASIHYHFPTKGDLGAALAHAYTNEASVLLDGLLAASDDPTVCIKSYVRIFRSALLNDNRMCLCGIMAAEHDDLPAEVRTEVDRFTETNIRWLTSVLALRKPAAARKALQHQAQAVFAAIEGAQLVARGRGDVTVFDEIVVAYRATGLIP